MLNGNQIELAKKYCIHYHEGQFRKSSNQPYHTHPFAVAEMLERHGYGDPVTQCIALLHDAVEEVERVEDSEIRMDEIQRKFGYEISNGVCILSKNEGRMRNGEQLSHGDYIQRLFRAEENIKRVKIADVIDNTRDLQALSQAGIEEKIRDAEEYYIPWGIEIAPIMVKELAGNITNYRLKLFAQVG